MKSETSNVLAIVATASLVVVLGGLSVQHFRHGWSFSLHHGMGVPLAAPSGSAGAHVHGLATSAATAHPRAEVQLGQREQNSSGVRVERVRRQTTSQPIRAMSTIVPDESRVSHVHTRVAGWIEKLYVTTTGERVRAGQPLAGIFSQELLSSQKEYLLTRRAAASGPSSALAEGARSRLKVLGMTDEEIQGIEEAKEPRRLVTVAAPRAGIVLHRGISVGTAVDPSTEIVTVADLSQVWVFAEVPESDIPSIQVGTLATLDFPGSGQAPVDARVEFLYPTLTERTRTLRVRFAVPNASGALRPGLYGNAEFRAEPRSALTVARDAVVDTGSSQHVFVVKDAGRFVPTVVKLGKGLGDRVEVLEGITEGETVVASGVFLIDSESRLRASGGGTGHAHGDTEKQEAPSQDAPSRHAGH